MTLTFSSWTFLFLSFSSSIFRWRKNNQTFLCKRLKKCIITPYLTYKLSLSRKKKNIAVVSSFQLKLEILPSKSHTILLILVERLWWYIKTIWTRWWFSLLSSPVCWKRYWCCTEKLLCDNSYYPIKMQSRHLGVSLSSCCLVAWALISFTTGKCNNNNIYLPNNMYLPILPSKLRDFQ